ncbi:DUF2062 domain-containing protein [Altericroceibacterium spongiae]|uniref:DUF2062 domain-containing protein n=1 Tax=Altericroceibacterium spongiae TaxID=2320269 RepID=A0A420EEW4_9SPHN|nr:DUF2062 domain-containing protein [Altericroceibacterium spongiae]RKF19208.1 DUF2062 domain-containing protein [Altericroceibacterium spongiae]
MKRRLSKWARNQMPTREQLAESRYVRHLAHRAELWRLTRRSVPRGVAIGLFVGIFAMIPGVQMVGAALMCVPCRANIPLSAAMTFLSNPATTPLIVAAALWLGSAMGFHSDMASFRALMTDGATLGEWTHWLLSDAAPALITGLFVISLVAAILGYLISIVVWRGIVMRRRQRRLGQYSAFTAAE